MSLSKCVMIITIFEYFVMVVSDSFKSEEFLMLQKTTVKECNENNAVLCAVTQMATQAAEQGVAL